MFQVGNTRIQKIFEMDYRDSTFEQLLPDLDPQELQAHPEWLAPGSHDNHGKAFISFHSWLVRHEGRIILVDTGIGNAKPRPDQGILDHLNNPYLERLAHAGVRPEEVEFILHTHIHSDHVGWNTRLQDHLWVPTFPNATVICSALEWQYAAALAAADAAGIARARQQAGMGEPVRTPSIGPYGDSMLPLEPTGKVRKIAIDGTEVLPGIRFISTPGHSIDHASIELISEGEVALFSGDVMHHPLEVYDPSLVSCFCEFPDGVRRSRLEVLEYAADRQALYLTSHFPLSSAGRITRGGDGFAWSFVDGT